MIDIVMIVYLIPIVDINISDHIVDINILIQFCDIFLIRSTQDLTPVEVICISLPVHICSQWLLSITKNLLIYFL